MSRAQIIITSCSRRGLEIEQVKNFLRGNGYSLSKDDWNVDPSADVILLSTCGFTTAAEDSGFAALRRIQEAKKPTAKVIFGGCIPRINPERVAREFDGPTFSPQSYPRLNDMLGANHSFEAFKRPNTFEWPTLRRDMQKGIELLKTFDGSLPGLAYISQRLGNGMRRRVIRTKYAGLNSQKTFYIQIQEGCSMECSYCVIRRAIGPLRSKAMETILDELKAGLHEGYRHFQLMGDNAGSYGLDAGTNMGHLLDRVAAIEGDFDLDLTDINPVYLPMIFESVTRLCAQGRLCSLYVPIQSANRRVLKLMNRDCDMGAVKHMLIDIKRLAPAKLKLGTSLIVGFPSETTHELDNTIEFCHEVGFDWVWCHSFSARPETPAACLPDPISADEILRRARTVKSRLRGKSLVTTAEDSAGSRTCQG
jgi:threonylcarbamoyladenosine tRNA methylthiotransferase MtaB